jgi:hypothetical protein
MDERTPETGGCVIATIGTDADDAVVERATAIARDEHRRLILIDRSAESISGATPYNDWRGDDDYRPAPDATVDAAIARREGRSDLAHHLESVAGAGVEVGGWFPTHAGLDGIREAIERFDGAVLVVPASVRDPSIGDRLRSITPSSLDALPARVVLAE